MSEDGMKAGRELALRWIKPVFWKLCLVVVLFMVLTNLFSDHPQGGVYFLSGAPCNAACPLVKKIIKNHFICTIRE